MAATVTSSVRILASPFPPLRAISSSSSCAFHDTHPPPSAKRLSFQGRTRRSSCLSRAGSASRKVAVSCAIKEIKESHFSDTVLNSDRPVLVEFVANWCGPCRLISPAMESVAQEYGDRLTVVKIDHDLNPRLIEEYKVYGLPTLILFKDGKEVPESRREGAITKVKLREYVDSFLNSISLA